MTFNDMQGITIVDLKGDGSRDIAVDNEGLCGAHMAGVNCSNRGCDMTIYKRYQEVSGARRLMSIFMKST